MKINFVCVCTDKYPTKYAEILIKRLNDVSKLDFEYFCITDRPEEVKHFAQPIKPFKKTEGWWNKCNLFSPEMPKGYFVYLDLDIVIIKNFDEEILWAIENLKSIACVSDAIGWMGEKFSSSMMVFKSGQNKEIFERFTTEYNELIGRPGGDQVWVGPQIQDVLYIDEKFPNLKKNLKFHLATNMDGNKLTLPTSLPEGIKMVDCGGNPKPDQLNGLPYIQQNWHKYL